jgi:hypothetical protein
MHRDLLPQIKAKLLGCDSFCSGIAANVAVAGTDVDVPMGLIDWLSLCNPIFCRAKLPCILAAGCPVLICAHGGVQRL